MIKINVDEFLKLSDSKMREFTGIVKAIRGASRIEYISPVWMRVEGYRRPSMIVAPTTVTKRSSFDRIVVKGTSIPHHVFHHVGTKLGRALFNLTLEGYYDIIYNKGELK